jgi:sulfate/thiosulfate transport system ATP-binding protein
MSIEVEDVSKSFGSFLALNGVSFSVRSGEFLALLGPSGSGKTTLLRILAGLEQPDSGQVRISAQDMTHASARERDVGLVFQHYALFRHMTVFDNVGFGLRVKPRAERLPKPQIAERVKDLLRLVQLDFLADRYPAQLSGGQRQRVALARALAVEPKVLLLDEPFGALDAKVRKELRRWLRGLHDRMGLTSIFVTHDQDEALELADRVAVMHEARIEQIDSPQAIYDAPATPFVYEFIGTANRFRGVADETGLAVGSVRLEGGEGMHGNVAVYARPHDIRIVPVSGVSIPASLRAAFLHGGRVRLELDCGLADRIVEVELDPREADGLEPGSDVGLLLRRWQVFAAASVPPSLPPP